MWPTDITNIRYVEPVVCMEEENAKIFSLHDLGIDGRILLKWYFETRMG
jgi:hypothetical protein